MVEADQLGREVNRLYWETDAPVTRLASELGISRGTFYNHLHPLPASGKCASCGAPLFFRTRSNRDSGDAHCEACGHEQQIRAVRGRAVPRDARLLRVDAGGAADPPASREAGLLAQRISWLAAEDEDDRVRTQLLYVAVGAAVLGLGILYLSRRR